MAGSRSAAEPTPARSLDAVRLGPEPGTAVAAYLTALPVRLPPPGAPEVLALVQFESPVEAAGAATLLAGVRPVTAVFRVPLSRVQTALRFQPLTPVDDPDPVGSARRRLSLAQAAATRAAAGDATSRSGRPAQVAAAEAAALAAPGCRCVLAVLVSADRDGLTTLAARPGVRAVDAAPVDTPVDGVALSPLLPEQTGVVGPVPDDGPLPPG
ncbi:MAG: hypothetical protein ACT4O0_11150 [Pseudonocardia sp.]